MKRATLLKGAVVSCKINLTVLRGTAHKREDGKNEEINQNGLDGSCTNIKC